MTNAREVTRKARRILRDKVALMKLKEALDQIREEHAQLNRFLAPHLMNPYPKEN